MAWGEGFAVSAVAIDIGKGIAIDGPRVGDGVIRKRLSMWLTRKPGLAKVPPVPLFPWPNIHSG